MRNYVSSTFEKWYIAIYVMKLEKSHLTGPIRVVPELTPLLFLSVEIFQKECMLNCLNSFVSTFRPQVFIKKLNSNFFHITVIVFSQYPQMIQCFSSRFMTFTQFNNGASPWRHLALLLTALALAVPMCAVVTTWRERLARRYARP